MAVQAACNFSPYICVTCGHASDEHPGGGACNIGGGLTLAACQCGLFVPAIGPGTPTPPSTTHIPTAELPRTSERIAEIAARLRVPPMTEVLREVLPDLTPEAAVRADRQRVYGDALECHTAIGRAWGGLLQQAGWEPDEPVPPHVVAAMMAALKLVRGVTRGGEYQADTYLDAKVYVGFLDEMHPGHPPRSPEELARDRDWAPCGECTHLRRVHAPDAGPCGAFECECHAFVML